ncbi:hypothetical protein CANMA_005066 [Candida margitis]|uniref:uncharacterized protein n=1 Tax=Candida margitis TaxID=1775924 RepID=UPI0022272330|nr:uncharacterized protein CANMA_005066 [Candida margitis]KAI5952223.1 hypothetical protein CANMA_005066 [Candida margitis]
MITLAPQELIDKCPTQVLDKIQDYERALIEKSSSDNDNLQLQPPPTMTQLISSTLNTPLPNQNQHELLPKSISINIDDVILDEENLPQIHDTNTITTAHYNLDEESDLNTTNTNPQVLEYLKFKKDHQLKFLKEIKTKGLVLKGSNYGVDKSQTNKFMNY